MNAKRFSFISIIVLLFGLIIYAIPTIVVDPYFHYHIPLEGYEYPMDNQRYQNDGMLKNFEYDALIAGTSMVMAFNTEEFDQLFQTNSVLAYFLGGSYKEINNNISTALEYNSELRVVLRGLDLSLLDRDKDYMKYELSYYPEYLYDKNIFNDIKYVWNKKIFDLSIDILKTRKTDVQHASVEEESDNRWSKENVLNSFTRVPIAEEKVKFTEEDRKRIFDNVSQNVTEIIEKYPDVTFYLFLTPYNICYWDEMYRLGKLDYMLEAEQVAIEEILQYKNIRLFSFADNFELICDLDRYSDQGHYSIDTYSDILRWIKNGEYEITKENYRQHLKLRKQFYEDYDYEVIFQ